MESETIMPNTKQPKPRNNVHKQALKDGVLRPKVIGDKRSKIIENQARKRELAYFKMNRKDYDNE